MKSDLRFIVICTTGRTGSTLLQGLLNKSRNVTVRGENFNFVYHLFKAHNSIKLLNNAFPDVTDVTHPFHGASFWSSREFIDKARSFLISQLHPDADTKLLGFKEVRWLKTDIGDDLSEYISFLRKLLPGVRFVLLTRNIDAIIESRSSVRFQTVEVEVPEKTVRTEIAEFFNHRVFFDNDFFRISYEQICAAEKFSVQSLAQFLEIEITDIGFDEALKQRHSYGGRSALAR